MATTNPLGRFVRAALLLASSPVWLGSCGSDSGSDAEPQIPLAAVNEIINLSNQQYTALRFDNGAVYQPGGVKGLIVVRQSATSYLAFERNCPYQPYDDCSRVRIDPSRLFLSDSCCGSQFSLQGQLQAGPARRPLRQYSTSLSGNILTIRN